MSEVKLISRVLVVVLAIACHGRIASVIGQETLATPTLDEVISNMTASEQKLKNIRIEAKTFEEHRTSADAPWERSGVCYECTAWYTGQIKGPARIDVHREVLRWIQGTSPFGEESYSTSFNGKRGLDMTYRSGTPGDTFSVREATIWPDRPPQLSGSWKRFVSGIGLSLNFLFQDEGDMSASQWLQKVRDIGVKFDIDCERFQDANCLRLTMAKGMYAMWFDLDHGYAFRGSTKFRFEENGSMTPYEICRVSGLIQAAPGVWFPAQTSKTKITNGGPERPDVRMTCRCTAAVANDPAFDQNIFEVQIPPGYMVHDTATGKRYPQPAVAQEEP